MASSIEITPELLAGFLDEAPEYLEMLDAGLMEFESKAGSGVLKLETPEDQEQMVVMFRAAHSLKGLAAAFGFEKIKELTHRMETLFDQVRMGKRDLTSESFETLFHVFDCLKALVQELSDESAGPVEIDDILGALDAVLSTEAPSDGSGAGSADAVATGADNTPDATVQPAPAEVTSDAGAQDTDEEASAIESEVFDDPELASLFVESTSEAIDELNQGLLGLEENPTDPELLNTVFRCAHNIKGASGAAGLTGMNLATHQMETVFDHLRHDRLTLDEDLMNAIFGTVDRLRVAIDAIRSGRIEDVPAAEAETAFCRWYDSVGASSGDSATARAIDESEVSAAKAISDDEVCVTVRFPPDFEEAAVQAYLIHNKLNGMAEVLRTEPDLDQIVGDTPLAAICYMVRAGADTDSAAMEGAISGFDVASVSVQVGSGSVGTDAPAGKAASPESASQAAQVMAPIGSASESSSASPTPKPPTPDAAKTPASPKAAKAGKSGAKTGETLRVDQERLDQLMNLGGELIINRARFTQIHGRFRELFNGKNLGFLVDDMSDQLQHITSQVCQGEEQGCSNLPDIAAISSQLRHLSTSLGPVRNLVEQVHDLRTAMFDFDEALHSLTRVSDGIQKGIMGTRMVPIGPLFNRFRRVVRDISKSNGKKVELVLRGETTELDKRMVDELGDPLTHMVRNSVDHGIELPHEREAAGKNPVGTVILEASHRGNSICIVVIDDGAGINIDRVKQKVVEREMATAQQVEAMSDRELMQYILKPGFSTAAVVTDLSGRGMGMDIVVNKIEKLSGSIEIDSTTGEGSRITIKLPLTLAILTSMVARIGQGIYALPLETVAEIITFKKSEVQWIQRRPVVRVRDRIVPLMFFEDIFGTKLEGLQTRSRESDELTLVIVGYEDDTMGLAVDELLGQEDVVIKSLDENYRNVRGVAGASIRGDGTVSLILDVGAMIEMASKVAPAPAQAADAECPVLVGA